MRPLHIDDEVRKSIGRTAEELRTAFLLQHNKGASRKQQILNHALVDPSVTDAEYRTLSLELKFAGEDGTHSILRPANGAKLLGRSLDSYTRAIKGLADGHFNERTEKYKGGGWCVSTRRWNNTTVRDYTVSPHSLRVTETAQALFDLLEPQSETADLRNDPRIETAKMRNHSNETANLRERNRKNAALTPGSEHQKKEHIAQHASCASGDEAQHAHSEQINGHPVNLTNLLAEPEVAASATPSPKKHRGPPFEAFWEPYPKKIGKKPAERLWASMPAEDRCAAIDGIPRYMQSDTYKRGFVKQGDTYLSKRTWEDDGLVSSNAPRRANGHDDDRGWRELRALGAKI
jgi:hypothetical protein